MMQSNIPAKPQPSIGSGKPATSTLMAFLWGRMAEMYGHKWTSSYGESPNEAWSRAISELSMEQIKAGVAACLKSGEAWPPSLPEFLGYCTPAKSYPAGMYAKGLPAPVTDKETAWANIHQLIAKARGG
jgi:hypothetical protein